MFDPLLKFETLILGRSKIARNVRIFPQLIVPERKLGFFVKIKKDENFNHPSTICRTYPG